MAIAVLQNEETSRRGKNEEKKRVGSVICRIRANRESINIKKNSEKKSFSERLIPSLSE